ncbi:hypothetical protein KC717_00220 [Candidatus Dojkabacteria bacterium]|uniref:Uncharacterized protein n=1 Tax=Candidatus Dojkabacteria bacterium TaxID=2099670 RepID=A0A955L7J0_9BACT|nr:hypothetical protein [Candidatus Dojkabacteria bacterium]
MEYETNHESVEERVSKTQSKKGLNFVVVLVILGLLVGAAFIFFGRNQDDASTALDNTDDRQSETMETESGAVMEINRVEGGEMVPEEGSISVILSETEFFVAAPDDAQYGEVITEDGVTVTRVQNENFSLDMGVVQEEGLSSYASYSSFGENTSLGGDLVQVRLLDTENVFKYVLVGETFEASGECGSELPAPCGDNALTIAEVGNFDFVCTAANDLGKQQCNDIMRKLVVTK